MCLGKHHTVANKKAETSRPGSVMDHLMTGLWYLFVLRPFFAHRKVGPTKAQNRSSLIYWWGNCCIIYAKLSLSPLITGLSRSSLTARLFPINTPAGKLQNAGGGFSSSGRKKQHCQFDFGF